MTKNIFLIFTLVLTITSCRKTDPSEVTVVDPGKLYRSGQLGGPTLDYYIRTEGIRTVINLRGVHVGEKWFEDEFNVTETKQVRLISLDFELKQIPHRRSLIQLLDALATAPRPILIHCDNGVERTGEAAAIYEMVVNKKTKAEAMKMLSKKYFYNESDDPSKKYFIEQVWQDENWARNVYDPCVQDYEKSGYYSHNLAECTDQQQ